MEETLPLLSWVATDWIGQGQPSHSHTTPHPGNTVVELPCNGKSLLTIIQTVREMGIEKTYN